MATICLDLEGTLEGFGGPITFGLLLRLQAQGHQLVTAGPRLATDQAQSWHDNGLEPDFIKTRDEIEAFAAMVEGSRSNLRTGEIIWVDDNAGVRRRARSIAARVMSPAEFMARVWD